MVLKVSPSLGFRLDFWCPSNVLAFLLEVVENWFLPEFAENWLLPELMRGASSQEESPAGPSDKLGPPPPARHGILKKACVVWIDIFFWIKAEIFFVSKLKADSDRLLDPQHWILKLTFDLNFKFLHWQFGSILNR